MWEVEEKVPRPDCLCMLFQERSASFPICLTCVHIAMTMNYKEKQFSTFYEKGRGKSRTLAWASVALDLGLRLCRVSHSVCLYDLSSLSHRLYSSLFFPLSPSLCSSFSSSPWHCRLSVNQQATYQRLLLHLCHSGIGIGTAHLLSVPSPLQLSTLCAYLSIQM